MEQKDLEERLITFANQIIDITEALPNSRAAIHLSGQLLRSGTSPALNYGEAQAAESRQDFLHKTKVVLKELRETQVNLKLLHRRRYLATGQVDKALAECSELVAIFTKSVSTTRRNM